MTSAEVCPKIFSAAALNDSIIPAGFLSPQLQDLYQELNQGKARHAFPFDPAQCMAPLPRAYQWADGSAYINHVELVRAARNSEVPPTFYTDPLMYQGGSDAFLGPLDDVPVGSEAWGIREPPTVLAATFTARAADPLTRRFARARLSLPLPELR